MKLLCAILALLAAVCASAQNYFVNSTFSQPAMGGMTQAGGIFSGWMITNNDGVPNGWTWQNGGLTTAGNWLCPQRAPSGDSQVAFILGAGLMRQTITAPSNGTYAISFFVGTNGPYYSTENFTLQVNATTVNRWTASFINQQAFTLISTNVNLQAGANTVYFIADTNGATPGQDGWGINFDLVQTAPYYTGYIVSNSTQQVFTDGTIAGTQNGVNYATAQNQNGWSVIIGTNGGSYNWSNNLTIGAANNITVGGPSASNPPSVLLDGGGGDGIFLGSAGGFITLQNLVLQTRNGVSPPSNMVGVGGSNVCFRITHCLFTNTSPAFGIIVGGINNTLTSGPFGLVDNCAFPWAVSGAVNFLNVSANGNQSHYSWSNSMTWGTTNCVCIENSYFSEPDTLGSHYVCEGQSGARITLRYCNMTNCEEGTHGPNSGAGDGTLQVEVYENKFLFNYALNTEFESFISRGGSTLFWSNSMTQAASFELGGGLQFEDECASSNGSYNAFIPSGSAYSGAGYFTQLVTNQTPYIFWGGAHDSQFAFGPTIGGASAATWYTTIANNVGYSGTNTYLYLKGTVSQTVTAVVRDVAADVWYQEFCGAQLFYPTNYPSFQQIGQGVTAPNQIGLVPSYVWTNVFNGEIAYISLGINGSDGQFIQQGRDIFTNAAMPGYVPLAYPSPLAVTNAPPVPPPTPFLLTPLGSVANGSNLH